LSFDKTGYQLTLFPLQPSTAADASQGNGSVQRESHFILKASMSLKVLQLIDW